MSAEREKIKSKIRNIPDFPKEGIMFRDITTLLKDTEGFNLVIQEFLNNYKGQKFDVVVGLEARGFIIGGALAYELGCGFVPVRKAGKLPHEVEPYEYELEYGTDTLEIHIDAIKKGDRVLVVDDLVATGGTALAGAKLVEHLGGEVADFAFVIDLPDLGGTKKLEEEGYTFCKLIDFEGH